MTTKPPEPAAVETIARYRLALVQEAVEPFAPPQDPLRDPEATAAFLHRLLADRPFEAVGALLLNQRHQPLGYVLPYHGTLSRAAVEPRAFLAAALLSNAGALVLFHRHPAGDPAPTEEDLLFTRRMAGAGVVMGIRLADHLILGEPPEYVSVLELGRHRWPPPEHLSIAVVRRRRRRRHA